MGQQQSPLIRLPPEVRTIIWQYVLGGKRIELNQVQITRWGRFAGFDSYSHDYVWRATIQVDDGPYCGDSGRFNLRHVTGLLKTCRLV